MKKILFVFIASALLLPQFSTAQETRLTKLFDKYCASEGFESTNMNPGTTEFGQKDDIDMEHLQDVMQDIEGIRILKRNDLDKGKLSSDDFMVKIKKAIAKGDYVEMASINQDDESVLMYVLEGNDELLREVALVVHDTDQTILITVTGNIDISKILNEKTIKELAGMKGSCKHSDKD